MKKTLARFLSIMLVLALLAAGAAVAPASAEEAAIPEEFDLFIAYGGDKEAENDWGWGYTGTDVEGITAVKEKIKVGETKTVSLTFDTPTVNSWYFAPCLVAEDVTGIGALDFTVTCKIDGKDVPVDMNADADGKTWWTEDTGDFKAASCIRLAGGFNEWATKYIAEPEAFTTIEYTITLNAVSAPEAPAEAVPVPEEFKLFIAYGGDKEAENDWGWGYTGTDVEGITAVTETIRAGESKTVSLTFDTPTVNSWYFAPCLVAEDVTGVAGMDFTVTCKIDGKDVPVDMNADADGKTWWTEDTGDFKASSCIRLAGGFNEWATKYIAEPEAFTTIEYTVTLNSVTGVDAEAAQAEEATEPAVQFDPKGTYHAYLLLQTPNWTFRDAWNSANGIDSDKFGNFIYGNETNEKYGLVTDAEIKGNGTYTVSVTDFGSIFADDFKTGNQDYFNILGVSTDIPVNDTVKITDVKLVVDGSTRHTYKEAYLNPDDTEFLTVLVQNRWNDDVKEISYYPTPATSLEIKFTVSGFDYDNEAQATEAPTEAPTQAPAPAPQSSSSTVVIVVAVVVLAVAVALVITGKKNKKQ